jgi:hypothetical protein
VRAPPGDDVLRYTHRIEFNRAYASGLRKVVKEPGIDLPPHPGQPLLDTKE